MNKKAFIKICHQLLKAYETGLLGQIIMPEDSNPGVEKMDQESRIAYFSLPMALNYQRNSYKLWQAALTTFNSPKTRFVFDVAKVAKSSEKQVRTALTKYKVALQPNKQVCTWRTIANTVYKNWGSFTKLFETTDDNFLTLKQIVNIDHKKGFPYLSGPKIFNYWAFIVSNYGGVKLLNRDCIEIAPDTHITQCSVKLGIISQKEADTLTKDEISLRWRELLKGSGIDPIDMHPPLWFWSRNGFKYSLD
ncbi:MAG: hypothetical protein WC705_03735 [Candidatus Paceibacterota bacterium]|jgi:hypothetical protein